MNQVEAEAVERDRGRVVIRHPPSAALVSSNDLRKAAETWTVLAQGWRRWWSRGHCGQVPALHSLVGLTGVVLRLSVLALWRSKLSAEKVCFQFLQLSQ